MSVSIVTVTHRSRNDIARYVESFIASGSGMHGTSVDFIIVENSGDTAIEREFQPLRDKGFEVTVLFTENRGFGAGCNAGAAAARNKVLAFTNPDVEFLDPIDPIASLAGSWGTVSQLNGRDELRSFDILQEAKDLIGELRGSYRCATPPPAKWRDVLVPVGSLFCVDRQVFAQIGGFDERIFLYHEEGELARRLHKAVGPPVYLEAVRIRHRGFGSQQSTKATLEHELDGLFAYAEITGEWKVLRLRGLLLLLLAPTGANGRIRLAAFAKRLARRLSRGRAA